MRFEPRSLLLRACMRSALLLSMLTACGGGGGGSSETVTPIDPASVAFVDYLHPTFLVRTEVPAYWTREEDTSEPELIALFSEGFRSDSDMVRESVFLYRTDAADTRPEGISVIRMVSSRATSIDGYPALEEVFDAQVEELEELDVRLMQISLIREGTTTGLVYVAERDQFDRNVEIARVIAARMRLGYAVFMGTETDSDLSDPGKPAIATDGRNFLVVSCREADSFPFTRSLIGRIVNEDRSIGSEFSLDAPGLPNADCGVIGYEVIFDGTQYWMIYTQADGPVSYVATRRISVDGTALDATPIRVSQNTQGIALDPAVSFDGSRLLVVWSETSWDADSHVWGAFVSPNGTVTAPFDVSGDLNETYGRPYVLATPQVAYGAGSFLVIWSPRFFYGTKAPPMPIFAQLVAAEGGLRLPQPLEVRSDADGSVNPRYPQVAFDGTRFLVAWIEGELHTNFINDGSFSIQARPVSAAGELIDGPASASGTLIASPLFASIGTQQVPKEFLKLHFHDGRYRFYWAANNYTPETGMYWTSASPDLADIETPAPVVTSRAAVLNPGAGFQMSEPNVASSVSASFVVWPTRFGQVEGWYED